MNSIDPWRVMLSSPPGEWMVVPAPYYGHPFYRLEEESDLFTSRGLGGAFIGAEAPARLPGARRTGLLADVAPVLAPATGGFTAQVELDQHQYLHAAICVDGKCYKTSVDLAPAITAVMEKMAQWHAAQHDGSAPPPHLAKISGEVAIAAVDRAVSAAGDALIGALLDQHVHVACAGWLDDIGNAIGGTLRAFKGPITAVATGVASAYGGPTAGAAAAKLAGPIIDYQADLLDPKKKDPKKAAATKQVVDQAKQAAKTDPFVAQALAAAQKAVAHTTVAYHVRDTAQKAAAGDPAAQRDLSKVVQEAENGDPAAKSTAEIIADTFGRALIDRAQHSEWGADLWEKVTGRGPATVSGWFNR